MRFGGKQQFFDARGLHRPSGRTTAKRGSSARDRGGPDFSYPLKSLSVGRAGVILDRDGTIIVDHGYVGSVERVQFVDGSAEAIAAFNRAGIPVAVVTNQAGVARGFYGTDDVEEVHQYISDCLAEYGAHIDLFLYCPYHPDGTVKAFARRSSDRKPEPGMALAAAQTLDLDLASSWIVGDRAEDMGLAAAVGASAVFIGPDDGRHPGAWSFPDLASASALIIHHINGTTPDGEPTMVRVDPRANRPKFPGAPFDRASSYCAAYFVESDAAARSIDMAEVEKAAAVLIEAYDTGAAVFACGNGGSASIANHLQCDHLKGVRTGTELWPRVVSLSSGIELVSAIANDLGYEDVFLYQLMSQARAGDVLVAISASGRSPNIVRAIQWARDHDVRTIAMTGFTGGDASELAEISIHVASTNYGVVEDNHQAIMHALAQYIRQSRMTVSAVATHIF